MPRVSACETRNPEISPTPHIKFHWFTTIGGAPGGRCDEAIGKLSVAIPRSKKATEVRRRIEVGLKELNLMIEGSLEVMELECRTDALEPNLSGSATLPNSSGRGQHLHLP